MTPVEFSGPGCEPSVRGRPEAVPLSHLSIELGHFYQEDLGNGFDYFRDHFRRIAVWVAAAQAAQTHAVPKGRRPRISTCVLIDDYFDQPPPPSHLLPLLMEAARAAGLGIDYFAREAGCADPRVSDGTPPDEASLAHLVEARLVEDPPPGTTAARPPVSQTGWLCNGQRTPTGRREAMKRSVPWTPPVENTAARHSIFIDVELWSAVGDGRKWSCPMLAAVWQLHRLGMLRDNGQRVGVPQAMPEDLPDDWRRLPLVLQTNPAADSFNAYRTLTICAPLFLPVEHAVRTIVERVAVDPAVLEQTLERAQREKITLPPEAVERIDYLFVDTGPVRGARPG